MVDLLLPVENAGHHGGHFGVLQLKFHVIFKIETEVDFFSFDCFCISAKINLVVFVCPMIYQ